MVLVVEVEELRLDAVAVEVGPELEGLTNRNAEVLLAVEPPTTPMPRSCAIAPARRCP
jgi:hypothetical protein